MHIIKVAYEAAAFDVRLTRGGVATMVWELGRAFTEAGHRVSVVTPAHGNAGYLCERYGAVEVGVPDEHAVPLVLDPRVWPSHRARLDVRTRTYLLRRDGVDLYFLANDYLDLLPDTLYPANEMQGHDLAFLKPMVFQADAIRFVDRLAGDRSAVVQCYEAGYTYLVPPAMSTRPGRTTVSTSVVNTRIDDMVYGPQVAAVLRHCGAEIDLDRYADPEPRDPMADAMRDYLRPSHLRHDPGPDHINYFALAADHSDLVDFVSPGQRDYYSTFRDTPFERRFASLRVARTVRDTAAKHFVGGCAMPGWWLERDPAAVDRAAVLTGLGLRPDRPTFYHAARLVPNHKGQAELFHAIDAVLREDREVNFVIRCAVAAAGSGPVTGDPAFQEIADRYPDNIYLDWHMVDERLLFDHAAVADFCLFPSKFELDGFLITMAEAMACGAVPIATAQETLSHYRHTLPISDPAATGFAVPRSFRTNDLIMAEALRAAILSALRIFREDPDTYRRLSRNSVDLARGFTWEHSAKERLRWFDHAVRRQPMTLPVDLAIEYGWFDHLSPEDRDLHRDRIRVAALARGDLAAYRTVAAVDASSAGQLFDAAYRRADFDACEQLADLVDAERLAMLRGRCEITDTDAGRRLVYHLPHAVRVDLVVPAELSTGTGSGNRHLYPLDRAGNAFSALLPPRLPADTLILLLTLDTGRVAWDAAR